MMKQLLTGLVAGAIAVLALVFSRPVTLRQVVPPPPVSTAALRLMSVQELDVAEEHAAELSTTAAVRSKLDKVIPVIEFDGATLVEVAGRFGEWTGANVVVDPAFPEPSRVSIRLKDMRAGDALRVALNAANPRAAGYRIWSGAVIITPTTRQHSLETEVRLYDVRDLIDEARRQDPAHIGVPTGNAPADPVDDLIKQIQQGVDPEGWRYNGGNVGTISLWAGRLVVGQTRENHRRIEQFLGAMREAVKSKR